MILRKVVLILLLALAVCLSPVEAQRPPPQQQQYSDSSSAPGEGDIAIMQKEIKWGMQEMQRYKTIRGNWPVRVEPSDLQVEDQMRENKRKQVEIISTSASSDEVPTRTVRGARPAVELPEDDSPHATYWKLLVSVF